MRIGLRWDKFQGIFPLKSKLFDQKHNTPTSNSHVDILIQYFSHIFAGDTSRLLNASSEDIDVYSRTNENGDIVACIEYKQADDNGGFTDHVVLAIFNLHASGSDQTQASFTPYFIMIGEKETLSGHVSLFPDVALYQNVSPPNNRVALRSCDLTDQDRLSAALCYADEHFKRILASLELDVLDAQKWTALSPDKVNERMSYITSRSEAQLAGEVNRLKTQETTDAALHFRMPAPGGYQ